MYLQPIFLNFCTITLKSLLRTTISKDSSVCPFQTPCVSTSLNPSILGITTFRIKRSSFCCGSRVVPLFFPKDNVKLYHCLGLGRSLASTGDENWSRKLIKTTMTVIMLAILISRSISGEVKGLAKLSNIVGRYFFE